MSLVFTGRIYRSCLVEHSPTFDFQKIRCTRPYIAFIWHITNCQRAPKIIPETQAMGCRERKSDTLRRCGKGTCRRASVGRKRGSPTRKQSHAKQWTVICCWRVWTYLDLLNLYTKPSNGQQTNKVTKLMCSNCHKGKGHLITTLMMMRKEIKHWIIYLTYFTVPWHDARNRWDPLTW